jgi:hypothetical protein
MTKSEAAMVKRGEVSRLEAIADRVLAGARRVAVKRSPRRQAEMAESMAAIAKRVAIRREVIKRDTGCCSCGIDPGTELDHFWGRGREESVESCWMLCTDCHRAKTDNDPKRIDWLWWFKAHCDFHGYREQAMKCDRAIALERGQHPQPAPTPSGRAERE